MIYIVSGYRRSGTTAMMQAIQVGGIRCLVSPEFYTLSAEVDGYMPLPTGCMEIRKPLIRDPAWLRELIRLDQGPAAQDFCLKVFFDDIIALPPHNYEVIFMRRLKEEIYDSCRKVEEYKTKTEIPPITMYREPFDHYAAYSEEDMEHVIGICRQRKDMHVTEIWFHELINDPLGTFQFLAGELEFDIDPERAAKTILPEWYRSKIEG